MPFIPFPNVPLELGVPPIPRNAITSTLARVVPFLKDNPAISNLLLGPPWGLFTNDGSLALTADSVQALDYRKDYRVSDYPVEDGGFASYNKVETPYDSRIAFIKGGLEFERTSFLKQVERIVASLDLYTIVTPERSYTNANAVHYDYSRKTDRGATLLYVEIGFEEIRTTATAQYSQTKTDAGKDTVDDGSVLPVPLDKATQLAVTG